MNIKQKIYFEFGAPVSKGYVATSLEELKKLIKTLNPKEYVVKAQIHAGGRGKAGGVKIAKIYRMLEIILKKCLIKF